MVKAYSVILKVVHIAVVFGDVVTVPSWSVPFSR
jgi:hypothetical protein